MYYTYILLSMKDNRYYTGTTNNLKKRFVPFPIIGTGFEEHNNGKVRSTASRRPFELIYYEACICKEDAFRREPHFHAERCEPRFHTERGEKYLNPVLYQSTG